MKTKAREENIVKYFNVLNQLYFTLKLTNKISMLKFSEQNNVTKNLSTVLKKGGIITNKGTGRSTEWYWNSIEPTREMAIKVLQETTKLNPPRKNHGGKRKGSGRKTREEEVKKLKVSYTVKIYLWGLIKIRTNYFYA